MYNYKTKQCKLSTSFTLSSFSTLSQVYSSTFKDSCLIGSFNLLVAMISVHQGNRLTPRLPEERNVRNLHFIRGRGV